MHILIVEDEPRLREQLRDRLRDKGYVVEVAADGEEGLYYGKEYPLDLAVIDIGLPKISGIELIRRLRSLDKNFPILILTARGNWEDKVEGLETGADDYLVKPFHLSELVARVHSVARRTHMNGGEVLGFGPIRVEPEEHTCFVYDRQVDLTRKELDLLLYFMANRNRVVTKEGIADYLWGEYGGDYGSYDFVYTHLKNMRRKLMDAGCPDYVRNIYGVGYKFSID